MSSTTTTIEPLYVVDTNALIWYLTKDQKLGGQAHQIFEAAEQGETQLILSTITMAEMYFANVKNGGYHPQSLPLKQPVFSHHNP